MIKIYKEVLKSSVKSLVYTKVNHNFMESQMWWVPRQRQETCSLQEIISEITGNRSWGQYVDAVKMKIDW